MLEGTDTTIPALRTAVATLMRTNKLYFAGFVADQDVDTVVAQIAKVKSWNNQGGDIAAQAIATVLKS